MATVLDYVSPSPKNLHGLLYGENRIQLQIGMEVG